MVSVGEPLVILQSQEERIDEGVTIDDRAWIELVG